MNWGLRFSERVRSTWMVWLYVPFLYLSSRRYSLPFLSSRPCSSNHSEPSFTSFLVDQKLIVQRPSAFIESIPPRISPFARHSSSNTQYGFAIGTCPVRLRVRGYQEGRVVGEYYGWNGHLFAVRWCVSFFIYFFLRFSLQASNLTPLYLHLLSTSFVYIRAYNMHLAASNRNEHLPPRLPRSTPMPNARNVHIRLHTHRRIRRSRRGGRISLREGVPVYAGGFLASAWVWCA